MNVERIRVSSLLKICMKKWEEGNSGPLPQSIFKKGGKHFVIPLDDVLSTQVKLYAPASNFANLCIKACGGL